MLFSAKIRLHLKLKNYLEIRTDKEMKTTAIILSLTFLAIGCVTNENDQESTSTPTASENIVQLTQEQMKNAQITVGQPERKEMTSTLKVTGVIDVPPSNRVSISNPLGGFVKKMDVLPGSRVRRGQVLVVMEDPQYIQLQQDYLTAVNRLEFLEVDFNRQRDLNADKSISDKSYQQVLSDYKSQKILVRALGEKLQLISINPRTLNEDNISRTVNIYSPIDGFVSEIFVNVGKYVNPADVLFDLLDGRELQVSVTVFEKDIAYVYPGQKLTFTTTSAPDKEYVATVHTINKRLDGERSTQVICKLQKSDGTLMPGMFVNGEFELARGEVAAVPEDAVVSWDNKSYVFVNKQPDTFEMIPVETGMSSHGFIEIVNLKSDTNLVLSNAYSLLMKLKSVSEE